MTREQILSALAEVTHPGQSGKSITELGMVRDIESDGKKITVTLGFGKRREQLEE